MSPEEWSWTSVVPSIITGLAAFLGVVITNRANYKKIKLENDIQHNRQQKELLRSRGEELYVISEKWLNGIASIYLRILPVMQGKYSYNDYLDQTIKHGEKRDFDFARIEMIIDVYFPIAAPLYQDVCKHRSEINDIVYAYKKRYEAGYTNGNEFIPSLQAAQQNLIKSGELLKASIKACLQSV